MGNINRQKEKKERGRIEGKRTKDRNINRKKDILTAKYGKQIWK